MSARRYAAEMIGAVHYEPGQPSFAPQTYSLEVTERDAPTVSPAPPRPPRQSELSDHVIARQILDQRSKRPEEYLSREQVAARLAEVRETLANFTDRFETELGPKGVSASVELERLTSAATTADAQRLESARVRSEAHEALVISYESSDPEAQSRALEVADEAEASARKAALAAQGAAGALERRGDTLRVAIQAAEITAAEIVQLKAQVETLEAWVHAFELALQMRKSLKRDIAKFGHEHARAMRTIVGRILAAPSKSEVPVPAEYPRPTTGEQTDPGRMRENLVADRVDQERWKALHELEAAIDD